MSKRIERRAIEWSFGNDTGSSSKAIARHMLGIADDGWSYPSDAGDLGRCVRLLDLIPEWRTRIGEMGALSPMWKALVEHWAELEAAYKDDDRALYSRMKELLNPAEDSTGTIVRFGSGFTIRTGAV